MTNHLRRYQPAAWTLIVCGLLIGPAWGDGHESSLVKHFAKAAQGNHRSASNRDRNVYRHPAKTLDFFGLKSGMTVLEISPGGLWYTEVLAPALNGRGKLIVAGYDTDIEGQPDYRYRQQSAMEARFAEEADVFGDVGIVKFSPPDTIALGAPESVDAVLTFRNSHGWIRDGLAEGIYQSFFEVLKPGGVLGVVQHRAPAGSDASETAKKGYVPEAAIIAIAGKAGFVLDARSEINANPKDDHDHPEGVWTLPPSLDLGDKDREVYLAIGESDRMTLRFRKPD